MPTPGVIEYPTALDGAVSLVEAQNNASSTLTSNISVGDLLIPVAQPGKFSNSGIATLTDSLTTPTKIEILVYTGKSGSNLVVPPGGRGAQGTTAQAFSTGNFVEQRPTARHHTALADAILALQTKLGIGADTPGGSAQALLSDGASASLWRAILQADVTGLSGALSGLVADIAALNAGKQPLDSDLTAIAALVADGFLRKVSSVWQMSAPKTAFSLAFGVADPSAPAINNVIPGSITWICPDGVQVTLTKSKYVFKTGSHTPGTGVIFNVQLRTAASGWTAGSETAVLSLADGSSQAVVQELSNVNGIVLNPGDTLLVYISARAGVITERDVTVCLIGTQQVI
jgi:hypothetical protein